MKKHKFNIFPDAKPEDFSRLKEDIAAHGFDEMQPIVIYEGDILDGWNRHRACTELGIKPISVDFYGSDSEAIFYVMRTNKRRNLGSGQWAAIAVEAEGIMQAIADEVEKQRRAKQAETQSKPIGQKIVPQPTKVEDKTAHKAAELFNTNRTYINQANKIKEAAPETFEKLKAGKITMQDAQREARRKPTDDWRDDERVRQGKVSDGETVIANYENDKNLIAWAESKGLAVAIDRTSVFGNPFVLGPDGDRDAVCDSYAKHYLPHKPSIQSKITSLRGKVLCCHCYPDRCHGESLKALIKP